MPTRPLTDEQLRDAVALRAKCPSICEAARQAGYSENAFRNRLAKAAERGFTSEPVVAGYAEAGEQFELPPGHTIRGISALVDGDGRTVSQWIKTRAAGTERNVVEALRETFDTYRGRAEPTPAPKTTNDDLLSVYILTDVHHGLLAWGKETGEDYDISIGSKRLRTCMSDLIAQAPPSGEALILNLGDYFHSNDGTNATPASKHVLDLDSRFYRVMTTGIRLFMDCIDLALQKHDRVHVRCLPGNHDPESSIALTVALSAFYHNDDRVNVEENPSDFFFRLFGNTLIGACHGHKMKPDRMAMSMATMRPKDWGAAKFRWFLAGHIHHESMKEVGDVRCETFQTIAANDAYSASHGYQSGKSLTSVTLHRERGEIGRHRVNVISRLAA